MDIEAMRKTTEKALKQMNKDLQHYERLARLTKHSKKKAQHLSSVKFMKRVIELAKDEADEYGWF